MTLNAQDLTCLSVNDLKVVRQIIAEREFYKASFEESEKQRTALTASRDGWKTLYESEKQRADVVQGGRVDALQVALNIAKDQMADDRVKIAEQNAEIIKLKGSRKWIFAAGAALGGVGGYYVGRKTATNTFNVTQPPNQFGAAFRF